MRFATILADPVWLLVTTGLLGLLVGSFLNVVAHRWPLMMERSMRAWCREFEDEQRRGVEPEEPGQLASPASDTEPSSNGIRMDAAAEACEEDRFNLAWPPSTCPSCNHRIKWYENIPVVSYLALRGRCSACASPIAARYPIVELCAGGLAILTAWQFGATWACAAALLLVWSLLVLSVIDLDCQQLPDDITLPMLWVGLLVNYHGVFVPLEEAVLGAIAGYLGLRSIYELFKLLTGKEGMGFGDFKLLAMLGAWLGVHVLLPLVVLSSFIGAIVGGALIALGRSDRQTAIPFGPFLAGAGLLSLFWGEDLVSLYLPAQH